MFLNYRAIWLSSTKQRELDGLFYKQTQQTLYDTFKDQLIIRHKNGHKGEIRNILE